MGRQAPELAQSKFGPSFPPLRALSSSLKSPNGVWKLLGSRLDPSPVRAPRVASQHVSGQGDGLLLWADHKPEP